MLFIGDAQDDALLQMEAEVSAEAWNMTSNAFRRFAEGMCDGKNT